MSSAPLNSMCMMVPVAAAAQSGIGWQPFQISTMHPMITQPDGVQLGSDQSLAPMDCAQCAQPNCHTWIYDGLQSCQQATINTTTSGMESAQYYQAWGWSTVPYMYEAHPHTDCYDWHTNKTWTKPQSRNSKSWCTEKAPQAASFDAEAEAIRQELRRIQSNAGSAADAENTMVNDLLRQLNAGEETVMKQFLELAFFSSTSSRAAQSLLSMSEVSDKQKARLASSLRGHLSHRRCAVDHPHANHVVQKIVEVLPQSRREFIVEELLGYVCKVAKANIGCRTLCRILEHLSSSRTTDMLVAELMVNVEELCRHDFGGYVVRKFLEHGSEFPMQKHQVAVVLSKHAAWYAKQQMSSFVMEAAIEHCEAEDQHLVAASLLSDRESVKLSNKKGGFHVLKALLLSRATKQDTSQVLERAKDQLAETAYGKKLLALLA